jgi:glycosyltransferase involved in cell wall biosynthesis
LEIAPGVFKPLRLLLASEPNRQPILFVAVDGFFQGDVSPYATDGLLTDTIVFANAVEFLLREAGAQPHQWVWCADWETGPALLLLRPRHHCALHLHNIYDEFLGPAVEQVSYSRADVLRTTTVLQAAMREADVVAGVNRGFVWSLQNETAYTKILAAHLQNELARVVPVENANFVPLTPELLKLEDLLSTDLPEGTRALRQHKATARRRLPSEIRRLLKGRALIVVMGRRVTQKMIEVAVESARRTLAVNPAFPALWFFATVAGDQHSDQRLDSIARLCADHPESATFTDGRIEYYDALLAAADLILMPSITEPHGGCFQAAVVPIVSARDGLAAQVPAHQATGLAAELNRRWHGNRPAAGWCVREELPMNGELLQTPNTLLAHVVGAGIMTPTASCRARCPRRRGGGHQGLRSR